MYPLRKTKSATTTASSFFSFIIVIIYITTLIHNISLQDRFIILRYWELILTGFFAVIHPYLLFPEENMSLLQALNPSPNELIRYQLRNQRYTILGITVIFLIISFWDLHGWQHSILLKVQYFLSSLLFIVGLFSYSYRKYISIGNESQAYQEGIKGERIRKFRDETGQMAVPIGAIPTMQTTIVIGIVGMLAVVFGAYLSNRLQMNMEWIPGFLLLAAGILPFSKIRKVFDHFFYQTNAFYKEYFTSPFSGGLQHANDYPYESVYWVPVKWRASTWSGIVQLDRAYPLGRFILLGHLFLWILFYHGSSQLIINGYLLLFIIFHNINIYLLTKSVMGKQSWNYRLQSISNWIWSRFFIQIRWFLPLILSLTVVMIFSSRFTTYSLLSWSAIYILSSLISSIFFTYLYEFRYQQTYD